MLVVPLVAGACLMLFAGASFGCALAETALFSLGQWRVRQLAERAPGTGALVGRLLASPQDLLATIVLGNTVANAGLVALGLWVAAWFGWPLWAVGGTVLGLILVGGEVIPKTLAVRAPEFWALRVARPMAWMQSVTRPLRRLAQGVNAQLLRAVRLPAQTTTSSAEEYRELLELGFQEGALGLNEKEIILQIVSLDRRTARDVMKPRAQMVVLPDDLPVAEMAAMARRTRHRRLPLYDGTPDTIVGVLNTRKLLLDPDADLSEAVEFPSFVSETINLLDLLRRLQRQRRGLAIVLDEYGSTAGLITTEDILGAVIGRIRSEGEAGGFVMEKLGPGRWRVNGTMRIEDFRREYPDIGGYTGIDTMGGLLTALAEVVPPSGFAVRFGRLRLTVTVADERRVRELLVEDLPRTGGAG
jgi:CBS domain containing-hemolysin-like protein